MVAEVSRSPHTMTRLVGFVKDVNHANSSHPGNGRGSRRADHVAGDETAQACLRDGVDSGRVAGVDS